MYGYKLKKPTRLPKIVWACKTMVDRYSWQNSNPPNTIEFSFSRATRRTVNIKDQPPVTLEGDIFICLVGNDAMKSVADEDVAVDIASVAVCFDALSYTAKELDGEDMADHGALLLPLLADGLSKQELTSLEQLLYRLTRCYMEHSAASDMTCAAIVLELLSRLDAVARRGSVIKKDKYINYYVAKADSILLHRYAEKLTLKSVAAELGITPNYLSTIYKTSTKKGFSERLCEIRMHRARDLLLGGKLTLFEISQKVGFDDESHLRRRFKQYFGVSVREYACIDKELTLFHDKPQKN